MSDRVKTENINLKEMNDGEVESSSYNLTAKLLSDELRIRLSTSPTGAKAVVRAPSLQTKGAESVSLHTF